MPTNDFLQFCPTDSGTNLPTQSAYAADSDRTSGNKPGIASAKLNNKALRQANFITSQLAQLTANQTSTDVLDDADNGKLLAQLSALIVPLAPVVTKYSSGTGTHNKSYIFFLASGSATAGATYTNNTNTFTVSSTIASGAQLRCTGNGAPTASGTLTKTGGTGDSSIVFYAVRAPINYQVIMAGGGGGGSGSGTAAAGNGGTGGDTTFGSALHTAAGGTGGLFASTGGVGGAATLGTGGVGFAFTGGNGTGPGASASTGGVSGGAGGNNALGGASGGGAAGGVSGTAAVTNTGGGGGGGGGTTSVGSGSGGGAGAYMNFTIASPSATYAYGVGAAGAAGTAGTSGAVGGAGGSGVILVTENFQ
jgi:hypothetical protein